MRYDVRLSRMAFQDLSRLVDPLASLAPAAETSAKARIWAAIQSLDRFPDRGIRTAVPGVRDLLIRFGRYGFVARYLVEEGQVTILRIFHALEDR